MYNSESLKIIEQGNWSNNNSSYYCYDEGFQFFDNVLKIFSKEGKLLNNFHLFGASDLDHHDIIYLNDNIISAGYLSPNAFSGDGLPGIFKPLNRIVFQERVKSKRLKKATKNAEVMKDIM